MWKDFDEVTSTLERPSSYDCFTHAEGLSRQQSVCQAVPDVPAIKLIYYPVPTFFQRQANGGEKQVREMSRRKAVKAGNCILVCFVNRKMDRKQKHYVQWPSRNMKNNFPILIDGIRYIPTSLLSQPTQSCSHKLNDE